MSSDRTGGGSLQATVGPPNRDRLLVNTGYRDRYRSLLESNLPPPMKGFAAFFAKLDRLHTMSAMLAKHADGKPPRILNAGSGAFAAELFSAPFQNRQITSFDYTQEFADLFPVFQRDGMLATTTFSRADANTVTYPANSFDVIVFHDIFYEAALNIPDVLHRFRDFLRPGGYLYLDFMSQSTELVWRLLGKGRAYKRYKLAEVRRTLVENGFELLELRRSSDTSNPLVACLNAMLWTMFRTSNAFAVIARKNDRGTG